MELQDKIPAAFTLWQGNDLPRRLRGPRDGSDLAPSLSAFARAIGRAGALRLAAVLGGTEQLVSADPQPEDVLSLVLGQGRARRLGHGVCPDGDAALMVPTGPFNRRTVVRQHARVLFLLGRTREEIAEATGVATVTVRRWRRDLARDGLMPAEPAADRSTIGLYAGVLNESLILARNIDLEGLIRTGSALPEWLQGPEDGSDLPLVLSDFAGVLGRARALLLSAYFGGSRVYLPRVPLANHRFAIVLGLDDTRRLAAGLVGGAGAQFELPVGPLTFQSCRAWRVRQLILTGMSKDRVALVAGINRSNVKRAVAKLRAEGHTIPATWTPSATADLPTQVALAGPLSIKHGGAPP